MKKDKVLEEFQPKHVQQPVIQDNLLSPAKTFRGQMLELEQIVEKSNPLMVDGVYREGEFIKPEESEDWKDLKK